MEGRKKKKTTQPQWCRCLCCCLAPYSTIKRLLFAVLTPSEESSEIYHPRASLPDCTTFRKKGVEASVLREKTLLKALEGHNNTTDVHVFKGLRHR